MSNLFVQAQNVGPKPLVTFRAGRMHKEGTTVKPDTRKGQVSLTQSPDGLLHFQWKDRQNGRVEDDLIIFPEEAKWTRVEKCKTGRVYVLEFTNSTRALFYWLQEPKEDKDKENADLINKHIKTPPPPPGMGGLGGGDGDGGAGGLGGALGGMGRDELLGLLGQAQGGGGGAAELMNALGLAARGRGRGGGGGGRGAAAGRGAGAAAAPAATGGGGGGGASRATGATGGGGAAAPAAGGGIDLAQLQAILQGAGAAPPQPEHTVDLGHVVDAAQLAPIVEANAAQFVEQLGSHLPEPSDNQTQQEALMENLRSAQFQQSADLFQAALMDPDAYNEITNAFGLTGAGGSGPAYGVEAFLNRVQQNSPAPMQEDKEKKDDKKEDEKPKEG
eukprot:TRINITY_DN67722_c1_g3_i1.p1 TRINITY_DN67722_c1_g3~~TRINITY_DN67722_c1_g3_i1.p1  ORF type:complete len:388 (-),score=99.43 TRINITY_DN67722_c1_g3_i1:864-2027(-)